MTTIIIVVVVALVFFVTVCVVTFMIWKREAEMRTDSIRAIENNLERLEGRLSDSAGNSYRGKRRSGQDTYWLEEDRDLSEYVEKRSVRAERSRNRDPFGWVRDSRDNGNLEAAVIAENGVSEDTDEKNSDSVLPEEGQVLHEPNELASLIAEDREARREELDIDSIELNLPELDELNTIIEQAKELVQTIPAAESEKSEGDAEFPDDAAQEIILPDAELLRQTDAEADLYTATGYDVGKSGKKYTAEELEMLIKE